VFDTSKEKNGKLKNDFGCRACVLTGTSIQLISKYVIYGTSRHHFSKFTAVGDGDPIFTPNFSYRIHHFLITYDILNLKLMWYIRQVTLLTTTAVIDASRQGRSNSKSMQGVQFSSPTFSQNSLKYWVFLIQ